jgi:hypothetical protein
MDALLARLSLALAAASSPARFWIRLLVATAVAGGLAASAFHLLRLREFVPSFDTDQGAVRFFGQNIPKRGMP